MWKSSQSWKIPFTSTHIPREKSSIEAHSQVAAACWQERRTMGNSGWLPFDSSTSPQCPPWLPVKLTLHWICGFLFSPWNSWIRANLFFSYWNPVNLLVQISKDIFLLDFFFRVSQEQAFLLWTFLMLVLFWSSLTHFSRAFQGCYSDNPSNQRSRVLWTVYRNPHVQ